GVAACSAGLVADPDDIDLLVKRAETLQVHAKLSSRYRGVSALDELGRAVADAGRALELDPDEDRALVVRGGALGERAMMLMNQAGDPLPDPRQSVADLERADTMRPLDAGTPLQLGMTYPHIAYYGEQRGADPVPAFEQAARHLRRATADPRPAMVAEAWLQLAYTLRTRAEHERRKGGTWRRWLDEAQQANARSCAPHETGGRLGGPAHRLQRARAVRG